MNLRALLYRWAKFNAVGAIGIVVQLAVLVFLVGALGVHYLLATGLAVESAVLHNFFWHQKWTWRDRSGRGPRLRLLLGRLIRFHVSNGLVSILGNLVLMRMLVGYFHLHYLAASLLSIAACSVANFLLSDRFVFRASPE